MLTSDCGLNNFQNIFACYLGCCFALQLLEEMLDNGFPLATESNVLKELIRPPSIVRNVVSKVTGDSK